MVSRSLVLAEDSSQTRFLPPDIRSNEFQGEGRKAQCLARVAWLRRELRRTPSWCRGHLDLAKDALSLGDISLAYGSCQAVFKLARNRKMEEGGRYILGKIYIARGMFAEAISSLASIACETRHDILEDLAAAYIGAGDNPSAVATLERIPEEVRSMSARTALSFAAGKHRS